MKVMQFGLWTKLFYLFTIGANIYEFISVIKSATVNISNYSMQKHSIVKGIQQLHNRNRFDVETSYI